MPSKEDLEKLKRKALFTPCDTKEDLHKWIKIFLGLDIPNCIVCDDDPINPSNSCPMDFIWSIYSKAKEGKDPNFTEILGYASRDSMKTLGASILELLCLFHLKRNVAHLAAVESQARESSKDVEGFFRKPILRDFLTSKNKRTIEITYYISLDDPDTIISPEEYDQLSKINKTRYDTRSYSIQILVATMTGTNSTHVPFLCVDGKTKILGRNIEGSNRKRKAFKARGLFRKIKGINPGGTAISLKEELIENPKQKIELLTFNLKTGELEFKPILSGFQRKSQTIKITFNNGKNIICTPEHPLFVMGNGFRIAKELNIGDNLVLLGKALTKSSFFQDKYEIKIRTLNNKSDEWEQVLIGSLLGDGGVYRRGTSNPFYSEQHSIRQSNYLNWKRNILSQKLRTIDKKCYSGYTKKELIGFRTGNSSLLLPYLNIRSNLDCLNKLEPLGLAVWYMDDGVDCNGLRFSTENFTFEQNLKLKDFLKKKFDIKVDIHKEFKNNHVLYYLSGGVEDKHKLFEICKQYIHPDLAYKFNLTQNIDNCIYCNKEFFFYQRGNSAKTCDSSICNRLLKNSFKTVKVTSIEKSGERWVYDFTVADNNNYFANGILSHNCLDELDLAPPAPIEESKMIPSAGENGELAITLMISTRKFAGGLVQKELDKAADTGLVIKHWNIIDVTQKCPPERHIPDEPKVNVYVNNDILKSLTEEEYEKLPDGDKKGWEKEISFKGCASCRLYAACRGRLATKQKSDSTMLKKIDHTIGLFRKVSPDTAKAQLLCWRPASEGLIYPNFSRERHMLSPAQIARKITGDDFPDTYTKEELIDLFKSLGAEFVAGLDHGFTHNFAVVTGAIFGHILYIIDVIAKPNLELMQRVELCKEKLLHLNPTVYPDNAYPSDNKTFKRFGFKMVDFKKDVSAGIESVRTRMNPGSLRDPALYLLKDDAGCELLAKRIAEYSFKVDANGDLTEEPNKNNDDELDALRYLCQNVPLNRSKIVAILNSEAETQKNKGQQEWLRDKIKELTQDTLEETPQVHGKKNGMMFIV